MWAKRHLDKRYCLCMSDRTSNGNHSDSPTIPLVSDRDMRTTKYSDLTLDVTSGRKNEKNLGVRLELRKALVKRRWWLVNLEFVLAMVGILLMVIENELYYANSSEKETSLSFIIKLLITITTVILLVAICFYYKVGIELRMFDGRVDDPFAVTPLTTWLSLITELAICAIHPFPGNYKAKFQVVEGDATYASIDGILSVLMMMRLYLVGKFVVVHSQLLTNKSTQNVSAVSHVKININFVLKAALNNHPASAIAAMMLTMYGVSVWSMRTCELYYSQDSKTATFGVAMWLSAITFLTVGYGDITPSTQCGRSIAVLTALMGLCSTALLVAVIARRLEQTHSERYVYNFITRLHLRNKFKMAAADVVKFTVKLVWMRKRKTLPVSAMDRTVLQWRLRSAIRTMRTTRAALADLEEASVGLSEHDISFSTFLNLLRKDSHILISATDSGKILTS